MNLEVLIVGIAIGICLPYVVQKIKKRVEKNLRK